MGAVRWLLAAALALAPCLSAAGQTLLAGAAKVEITPEPGVPMDGYGDRMGHDAIGVRDPLWARCLFLDDGETALFLVNADLCHISPELRARVLELAPDAAPRDHVILTATHTHNAHGGMSRNLVRRWVSGRYVPELVEHTARGIVQSMIQASENTQRAAIGFGTGTQEGLSVNRRVPGGPIDAQIGVIRVDDGDGNPIAIAANFAAHPTTAPASDRFLISADFPGVYYERLEAMSPEGCIALFLQGAAGNQACAPVEGGADAYAQMERTGRLLAERVKEISNGIGYTEPRLRVAKATPEPPPTLAASFQPGRTVIQSLEIGGLHVSFFPGEPNVEIGLALRERALARGYAAHFSVGLANDNLLYFVPRAQYADDSYESAMHVFGPGMESWLYRQYTQLMSRGTPEPGPAAIGPPVIEERGPAVRIVLEGAPHAMGHQRGAAFQYEIQSLYEERVAGPVRSGALKPDGGWLSWLPPFLDGAGVLLPAMSMSARPLLEGLSPAAFDELEGLAAGAALPFDAVWLLQHAEAFAAREDRDALFSPPFLCTIAAAMPERTGGGPLVGRNLDWPREERPVIVEARPDTGYHYLQVGFPWNTGVYTGMNARGLIATLERASFRGEPPLAGPAAEYAVRNLLQQFSHFDDALNYLVGLEHLRGFHVLLAGRGDEGWEAAVVEYGARIQVRRPEQGLLLGMDPGTDGLDAADRERYQRARAILEEAPVDRRVLETLLTDASGDAEAAERARIWNGMTRHSVIFEPAAGRLHVSFPGEGGRPGVYNSVGIGEAAGP